MADNSYGQLIDDYENGILVEPGESLTDYIKRMGGVDYKADGGSIGIEVLFQPKREEYQTGGISVGGSTSLASLRRQGYKPDSRATLQDYTGALRSVSAGTTAQQQADAKRYARNEAANELRAALRNSVGMGPSSTSPISNLYNNYGFNTLPGGSRLFGKQGNNFTGVMKQYGNNSDYDKVLDKMVSEKLQPTEYSQPKIDQRRQEAEAAQYDLYSQAFGKKMEDTYGKASDYAAEAMTLGMPVEAYYDYLATGDEKDLNYKYQQAIDGITNPYYDEKFSSYSDIYGPELPRNPYQQYFQSELQRQTSAGIPVGQRIQQGQVLGLPTVLSGGAPGSQMGPGYESYADVLARNKKMMGLRDGGRVGLFMGGDPLTGQALSIYDSMNAYGFTDQQIANALEAQGLYGSGSTPASDTPVTNTATNIINRGGDTGGDGGVGGGGGNTLQSFKQDPRVASAFEALERNQQLTSMGINDPFANEASLSGAYYDDMPTDTSNQVGVYQPSIMENIKNKIGGTKIGSMFTGAADKLTNNKFVNALGTAVSFAKSPIVGGAKMLTSGLAGLTNRLPTNQRAITQNIAGNLGIRVDDSGKIRGDYTTPAGVMSGYGLYGIDADTFDNRIDRTTQTLTDKYGFTAKEIEEVIDGTYKGNKGYNKIMGKQTNLIRDLRNINIARGIILNSKELGLKEFDRIEKEKAAAKSRAESAKQYDSSVHGPVNYGLGSDGKQSYDTGLGFGTNATTGGPVSNRTGRGRTDYSRGGLATMFKNKR